MCTLGVVGLTGIASAVVTVTSAARLDEMVELPPFTVTHMVDAPAWQYASAPGYEILTQCEAADSREVFAALWRGRSLTLPAELWPDFSLPMTVVLFNQAPTKTVKTQSFTSTIRSGDLASHWANLIKRTLEDRESFALNLWQSGFSYSSTFRVHIRTLLWRRTPAAPAWLQDGLFGPHGVYREGVDWSSFRREKSVHVHGTWWSPREAAEAQGLVAAARSHFRNPAEGPPASKLLEYLPALADVLEQPPPQDQDGYARWAAMAGLFVRWGIYERKQGEAAFWRFAEQACAGPVSEDLFRRCFGLSYTEARAELSWRLPLALNQISAAPAEVIPPPRLVFRKATPEEVGRLRGEWERMEAAALAQDHPALAKTYREQAAESLAGAYAQGSRHPQLLASLGLLALDNGDLVGAAKWLESAVAGHVPGPRPYLELARLRWAAGRLSDDGALPPDKLTGIVDLIMAAERQQPPLASIYLLLAEALKQTGLPTPDQRAALERGRQLFPRQPEVQAAVARALVVR